MVNSWGEIERMDFFSTYWTCSIATRHGRFSNITDSSPYNVVCTIQLHLVSALMTGCIVNAVLFNYSIVNATAFIHLTSYDFSDNVHLHLSLKDPKRKGGKGLRKERKKKKSTRNEGDGCWYSALGIKSQIQTKSTQTICATPCRKTNAYVACAVEETKKPEVLNERTITPWETRVMVRARRNTCTDRRKGRKTGM